MVSTLSGRDSEDPITRALRPPKDETPEQRAERIRCEQEAVRVSEEIDKEINRERAELKKRKPEIKVLLLGPSCAGKSTALKNFQLAFTPNALQAEAAQYTALIYLNVVSSVRLLCDVFNEHSQYGGLPPPLFEHAARLQPVLALETVLMRRFGDSLSSPNSHPHKQYEISVRAGGVWKKLQSARKSLGSRSSAADIDADGERVRLVLADRQPDIEAFVQSDAIRELVATKGLRLEHLPGYFLDDLDRILAQDYNPTDDDILRTRIRTLGVTETRFTLESGPDKGQSWVVIDVGGARQQRAAWVPYFDDVNAVIFVAPIGQFDQFLEEDMSINCLRDTLELWESITANKLLADAEFILFLNKFDILSQKIKTGVNFASYVTSYRDRNDATYVGRYLQKKFAAIHKQRSPKERRLHVHFTSVTDKSSTVALISHFRLVVLRSHLRETTLL